MKGFLLILSIFLSCLYSGSARLCGDVDGRSHGTVVESARQDTTDSEADYKDLAILPVRAASYSGDGSGSAPSVRSTNSGRRVQSSTRSAFRVIKAGKVFDRINLNRFREAILQFPSGIYSNSRYIHTICHLLI